MSIRSTEANEFEYPYSDAANNVNHAYLLPPIRRKLSVLPAGARVMDLGCGNGSLTAAWAHRDWKVFGVDVSESGISNAKLAYPAISFSCAPISADLAITFGEGSFDAIACAEVIEHIYLPRVLVKCAFQLLRPGGLFVLTTPYHGYLKNLALAISGNMDRHWTVLWDGGHIKFWSWKTIREVLEESGFVDIQFGGTGRIPLLWKSMVIVCRKP
jgi:2-polyprenyl-6-hydroxyphenyl methylase/3-demethylubiquinone-9 3-methyltransferase